MVDAISSVLDQFKVDAAVSAFLRGRLLICLIVGASTALGLAILGGPALGVARADEPSPKARAEAAGFAGDDDRDGALCCAGAAAGSWARISPGCTWERTGSVSTRRW